MSVPACSLTREIDRNRDRTEKIERESREKREEGEESLAPLLHFTIIISMLGVYSSHYIYLKRTHAEKKVS